MFVFVDGHVEQHQDSCTFHHVRGLAAGQAFIQAPRLQMPCPKATFSVSKTGPPTTQTSPIGVRDVYFIIFKHGEGHQIIEESSYKDL